MPESPQSFSKPQNLLNLLHCSIEKYTMAIIPSIRMALSRLYLRRTLLISGMFALFVSCKTETKQDVYLKKNTGDVVFFNNISIQDPQAKKFYQEGLDFVLSESYGQALDKFNDADALEPNNPIIITSIGTTQFKLGSIDASFSILESVIAIDETYLSAYINLGLQYNRLQRPAEGVAILEKGLPYIHGYDADIVAAFYNNLAICYWNSNNCDSALAYADLAFEHARAHTFKNAALQLIDAIEDSCEID